MVMQRGLLILCRRGEKYHGREKRTAPIRTAHHAAQGSNLAWSCKEDCSSCGLVVKQNVVNSSKDLRGGYLHVAELERLPTTLAGKYDDEVPIASHKLAQKDVEAGFFLQECKASHFQEMTIPNHYIWLYSDKTILYMVKLTLLLVLYEI
ncbi:hypothetical protein CEXT_162561 [Caerostris extrusa]|uniref:Uncharacterized protein n=1 Tax=Caerostris extrusa TaxID=172846 RepID=A0AAV4XFI3_CAEEX|nr:hypothetical protein CEXT_162561 [Caerostris extrusa]